MEFKPQLKEYYALLKETIDRLDYGAIEAAMNALLDAYRRRATIYVFGNGGEDWLNNAAGSAVIEENLMTEVADNIFCLRTNVTEGSGREFRVSYCGNMNFTFGGSFEDYGVWTDAAFNGKPVSLDIGKDVSKLCIFLDMREFDMATKEGARFGAVALAEGERFRLPKNTFKSRRSSVSSGRR